MANNEDEVLELMKSTQIRYFPDLPDCVFCIEHRPGLDGEHMRVAFDSPMVVTFYYGDARVLGTKYRMGLVPVICHELAHIINPVDPEQVMRERLPASVMELWGHLCDEGYATCSMSRAEN